MKFHLSQFVKSRIWDIPTHPMRCHFIIVTHISTAKVWRFQKTVVSPQENFVPNREKKDFRYL